MTRSANDAASSARAGFALILANARYWSTVAPHVQRELRRWRRCAELIPDPVLRGHALAKLRDEHFNAQVAATLATLAPKRRRARVIEVVVAFQVMYDYLDALGEEPTPDPLRNGHRLFQAFTDALTLDEYDTSSAPYYRHHPQQDDGGYLTQLVSTCRLGLSTLPAAHAVVQTARQAAMNCGQAQARTHAIPLHGTGPLRAWASVRIAGTDLRWWEYAAGCAASSLAVHALIAAAADPATSRQDAVQIDTVYLLICALSTLLDSLVDHEQDVRDGSHRYIAYYENQAIAAQRIAAIARKARTAASELRDAPHHTMTVAGVAGYYLSAPGARSDLARPVTERTTRALRPIIAPVLAIFRLWRVAKHMNAA